MLLFRNAILCGRPKDVEAGLRRFLDLIVQRAGVRHSVEVGTMRTVKVVGWHGRSALN